MPDSLYPRLSQIGLTLTEPERRAAQYIAKAVRDFNRTHGREDDLGELADQLDALAMPIVVQR